jgi:glycosyltransferase involved in cell wall biosynthesis
MILTVLTPTLNCRRTIIDTLNSVVSVEKNFKGKVQHLIGDGGSNDGTVELIREYCNTHPFIKLFNFEGLNIPSTLNSLINLSIGNYLLILNGDDYILVDNFSKELRLIQDENFNGIYCGAIQIESHDSILLGKRLVSYSQINNFMSVNHPAMISHKSVFANIGNFDVESANSYDYCWTWKAFKSEVSFKLNDISIASMRLGGISQRRARLAAREIFLYKIKADQKLNAYTNYIIFYFKFFIKTLLPVFFLVYFIKIYRKLKKSKDYY